MSINYVVSGLVFVVLLQITAQRVKKVKIDFNRVHRASVKPCIVVGTAAKGARGGVYFFFVGYLNELVTLS